VLDLAAGTGRVTSLLIPRGLTVVAVEPDERARSVFGTQFPSIECLDGTAEAIPLPDDSLDAVVVGKAWHLFDAPRALAEISRVLRDDGRLGVFATSMDTGVEWVRGMFSDDSLHSQRRGAASFRNIALPPEDFSPVEETVFRSTQSMDVANVVAWFKTRGVYREADEHAQQTMEGRITEALQGAFPDKSTAEIPVMTLCWRTERRPR
jgi:ubiquinone/menaquinone biosynthesis C-methylase UbiE